MVSQITSKDAQTIQNYMAAFNNHKQSLGWALGVHVAFTTNTTLEMAKDTQDTTRRLGACSATKVSKVIKATQNNWKS